MNKVINGKRYDTDKAKLLGSTDNGKFPGDFDYESESLYRKKTGEYFLHGEGGARTCYATPTDGGWASGELIRPVSVAEAKQWAEAHLTGDEYEAAFSPVDECAAVAIPAELLVRVGDAAAESGMTKGELVAAAIEAYLDGK